MATQKFFDCMFAVIKMWYKNITGRFFYKACVLCDMQWKRIRSIPFTLKSHNNTDTTNQNAYFTLEMWANAQRDGHPAEHRWRPLFNTAKFG